MALLPIIQTGSKLDFVHLSSITDGVNQALKKRAGEILTIWYFWLTIEKVSEIPDAMQPVAPLGLCCDVTRCCYTPAAPLVLSKAGKISIAHVVHSLDPYKCTKSS